jgi:hypothetical protein
MRKIIMILSIMALGGCGVGDVNSDTHTSSSRDDHSTNTNNGIANCEITCEPTEGGWVVSEICSGLIQDGPVFADMKPPSCGAEEPLEDSVSSAASSLGVESGWPGGGTI